MHGIGERAEDELPAAFEDDKIVQKCHVGENGGDQIGEDFAGVVLARRLVDFSGERIIELVALAHDLVHFFRCHKGKAQPVGHLRRDGLSPAAVLIRDRNDGQSFYPVTAACADGDLRISILSASYSIRTPLRYAMLARIVATAWP